MMIEMGGGISLLIREPDKEKQKYPSCRIQNGLVLFYGKKDLSEEGIGFGVPILKFGMRTIFPGSGSIELKQDVDRINVKIDYDFNLAETIVVKDRRIENRTLYKIKELLSWLHRNYPFSRKLLMQGSTAIRRTFELETRFEEVASAGYANVEYNISADGLIRVNADLSRLRKEGCTEVIIMNEQGANYFDTYFDSNGTIYMGNKIGSWKETSSDEASFKNSHDNLIFTLSRVRGSRMFYGREFVPNRLAWSGIAYLLSPLISNFAYDIWIGAGK
jgi:hypothetical protein